MTLPPLRASLWGAPDQIARVWGAARLNELARLTDLRPGVLSPEEAVRDASAAVVFTTWGMPSLTPLQVAALPNLKAVFYAAGSVQHFAGPLLDAGIAVFSAWQSNAVPVAEFTLAQILLSCKGYWRNAQDCATPEGRSAGPFHGPGVYGETIALLGAGAIGRRVIDLLRPFRLRVLVFDPFLSEEEAARLGVVKVGLDDAFARGLVVSNHLANKPETVRLIGAAQFARMRDDATFVNTGRGATVDEDALAAECARRPSLTALLDVTFPEPPRPDSPLYALPNVHLSSHIAGSIGDEVGRMADAMLESFARWRRGEDDPERRVTPEMLARMA